jgi:pimeloyl-ACP methyl ester carboxylesterase
MTRSIDVDGLAMRVRVAGLEQRIPGHAVIVFESGGGAPLETWDSVLPAVARFAPLVAYDRAGTGASAWDGLPPTPARVGARLSRLLDRLAGTATVHSRRPFLGRSARALLCRSQSGRRRRNPVLRSHRHHVGRLRSWASDDGTFHVAVDAGHMVHADDPDLVLDAIRRLAERALR